MIDRYLLCKVQKVHYDKLQITNHNWFSFIKKNSPINEVPYLRKYHHSKIRIRPDIKLEVPVSAT